MLQSVLVHFLITITEHLKWVIYKERSYLGPQLWGWEAHDQVLAMAQLLVRASWQKGKQAYAEGKTKGQTLTIVDILL